MFSGHNDMEDVLMNYLLILTARSSMSIKKEVFRYKLLENCGIRTADSYSYHHTVDVA